MFKSLIPLKRPHKASAGTDMSPSWQALDMIVLCRQTNVERSERLAITRLSPLRSHWMIISPLWNLQGEEEQWPGLERRETSLQTDTQGPPTHLSSAWPLISFMDWRTEWDEGGDEGSTFCSIRHEAHDGVGHKGRGKTKCWVGAGRHSDFPWRSRDPFYSFLWC